MPGTNRRDAILDACGGPAIAPFPLRSRGAPAIVEPPRTGKPRSRAPYSFASATHRSPCFTYTVESLSYLMGTARR